MHGAADRTPNAYWASRLSDLFLLAGVLFVYEMPA